MPEIYVWVSNTIFLNMNSQLPGVTAQLKIQKWEHPTVLTESMIILHHWK